MQAARGASLNPSDPDRRRASRRALTIFVVVALLAYGVDLLTKTLALRHLDPQDPVPLVGELLELRLVRNPGAAFSMGTSFTAVLTVVAVVAVVVVLVLARRLGDRFWAFGLGCLLGGVLGNLTDRVFREPSFMHGHVVDFLALPNWPVFNVADICINVAAGVIILQALRGITLGGERAEDDRDAASVADRERS
ncbi:signal peptidase II [Nocardioides caldifontis]|uniref:signal peptidase II n=1 Tax=Nocardioides caldifontis TaxID=2588938 RepID=UPI0011DF9B4A|nr:signal peptidase II [Nocardioides caldifontis]